MDAHEREALFRIEHDVHEILEIARRAMALWQHGERTADHAVLIVNQGATMPITVDTTNATVEIEFEDDHGDVVPAPTSSDGSGPIVVTFVSDTPSVLTVGATTDDTADAGISAALTPVATGTANISVTVTNASGTPLLEADGTTPFTVPAPVAVTVGAGPASELVLSVND